MMNEVNVNKMDREEIKVRVAKIVSERLGVEIIEVKLEANFIEDLKADSLDTVELVMTFEEEFGCEIPDDVAETILTVGDAVSYIEQYTGRPDAIS